MNRRGRPLQEERKPVSDVEVPAVSNPSTTITRVPIAELKLNRRNPRVHSERQIEQLSKSIKSFGFLWPVMIDGTQRVLAGHGRIEAAKRLGFQEVPTISIHHLSESQQRAFMIADNRLAEQASWDEKLLAEQLKELCDVELDFDLEATGFEVGEIDVLIEGVSPRLKGNSDPADDLPETKPVAVTRVGDLWLVGPHRIYCGNPLNPDRYSVLMGTDRAAMVLTDPPFNVEVDGHDTGPGTPPHRKLQVASSEMTEAEFTDFLTQVMQRCAFYSVEGSLHYAFTDWRRMAALLVAGKKAYSELMDVCVWVKDNDDRGLLYKRRHELIFVFKSGKESHSNNIRLGHEKRCRTNVWNYRGVKPFCHSADEGHLPELHPSTKPVALVAEAILDCTSRRDIVLDPFLRSGTTVIAAERTSRVCYGIELDPQYVDTIVRRCQAFTGQSARLECSGRTFAELEQEAGHAVKG
jgi:DNA modification methylase